MFGISNVGRCLACIARFRGGVIYGRFEVLGKTDGNMREEAMRWCEGSCVSLCLFDVYRKPFGYRHVAITKTK
jgi:chemotaxis receptor (MCP) glutamine deamidase CheD